jgi:hypothetical protein
MHGLWVGTLVRYTSSALDRKPPNSVFLVGPAPRGGSRAWWVALVRRQVPTEIHSRLENTHVTSVNFYRGSKSVVFSVSGGAGRTPPPDLSNP